MHEYNLLEFETADCDRNFCISRAESSPGIFQDQQHFFFYLLFDAEHFSGVCRVSGVSPAPPVLQKRLNEGVLDSLHW